MEVRNETARSVPFGDGRPLPVHSGAVLVHSATPRVSPPGPTAKKRPLALPSPAMARGPGRASSSESRQPPPARLIRTPPSPTANRSPPPSEETPKRPRAVGDPSEAHIRGALRASTVPLLATAKTVFASLPLMAWRSLVMPVVSAVQTVPSKPKMEPWSPTT